MSNIHQVFVSDCLTFLNETRPIMQACDEDTVKIARPVVIKHLIGINESIDSLIHCGLPLIPNHFPDIEEQMNYVNARKVQLKEQFSIRDDEVAPVHVLRPNIEIFEVDD